MLNALSDNPLVVIPSFLIFIGFAFLAGITNRWRLMAIAIPFFGWAFFLGAYGLGLDFNTIAWIEAVTLILWIMYLFGPFMVSAWVVTNERFPKTPQRIYIVLIILTILIAGYLYSYLFMNYPYLFQGDNWYAIIVIGIMLMAFGYWLLYGLYPILLTYFSLDRQDYQCRVVGCRIHKARGQGDGYRRIVSFDRDPNEYSVTPSVYKELERNIGAAYTYTLITSFNGKQFIRKRPKKAALENSWGG